VENNYLVLELKKGASKEEIQKSFDRLSIQLDPKNNNNSKFFINQFELLNDAYSTLMSSDIPEPKSFVNNNKFSFEQSSSIKDIFENYKKLNNNFKPDLINVLLLNINSSDIKYKIVLNVICEYERVSSIEKLLAFVNNKYKIK